MSIFNPGYSVSLQQLRSEAAFTGWSNTTNISVSQASNYYYGAPNNLAWFRNKDFKKLRILNGYPYRTSPYPSNPAVNLVNPYTQQSGTFLGANITPPIFPESIYIRIDATMPYNWYWQGWYTQANGGGDLISSQKLYEVGTGSIFARFVFDHWSYATYGSSKCFHPDTLITMYDDTKKKVKDIEEGELVSSASVGDKPVSGWVQNKEDYLDWNDTAKIPNFNKTSSQISKIDIVNVESYRSINNGMLITSIAHPMLVEKKLLDNSRAWTVRGAFNITEGDVILDDKGNRVLVEDVKTIDEPINLYEITVVGNDTIIANDIYTITLNEY